MEAWMKMCFDPTNLLMKTHWTQGIDQKLFASAADACALSHCMLNVESRKTTHVPCSDVPSVHCDRDEAMHITLKLLEKMIKIEFWISCARAAACDSKIAEHFTTPLVAAMPEHSVCVVWRQKNI